MQSIHTYMPSCSQSLSASMPTIGLLSNLGTTLYKKPVHWRNNSGELDVFEATKYFSGAIDDVDFCGGDSKEESVGFDADKAMPEKELPRVEKRTKDKWCKQPSSPAARLASLFFSFFNQTTSRRRSKSITPHHIPSTIQPLRDEEEISFGRRKGRNSMSHSQSIRSSDSKPSYSCESSGFRTPIYSNTPPMVHKEVPNFLNNKCNVQPKSVTLRPQSEVWKDKRIIDVDRLAEKNKYSDSYFEKNKVVVDGYLERVSRIHGSDGFVENKWVLNKASAGYVRMGRNSVSYEIMCRERKSFRRTEVMEDERVSDASSDLFELKNIDLGNSSSGLPVFGTTRVETIRKGTAFQLLVPSDACCHLLYPSCFNCLSSLMGCASQELI